MENLSIRKHILCQRREQDKKAQRILSCIIIHHLAKSSLFIQSKKIAFYFPTKGEVDPIPLMQKAFTMRKSCYLPVLHPFKHNRLWFVEYKPGDILRMNSYGILEPDIRYRPIIPSWALDLVITPLVAFDESGNRLGMGKGYYDRTFAFLLQKRYSNHPHLVGLAYEFQKVPHLTVNPWDVPLHRVVTEKGIHLPNRA